uniref:Uncharacterized protein n=1 Tax=uncultured bacterium contig00059 TaxID=1181542 RepID=A0A0A6ZH43_9BACT|nr:hypothetical protein [uncultured bacterium contig00059]
MREALEPLPPSPRNFTQSAFREHPSKKTAARKHTKKTKHIF